MTTLRQKLIQEIAIRGYSPKTQEAYVAAVAKLAGHYKRSPDQLSDEEIKGYLYDLHTRSGKSASTLNVIVSGQRFFYKHVLHRSFDQIERDLPRVKQPVRRPQPYSLEEIQKLLTVGCPHPKHRVFLTTIYSAGLRLNEACHLQPHHIESSRMMIRVEQGKGKKDRYTLLSEKLLIELRAYWNMFRPQVHTWLFPSSRNSQQPMIDATGQRIFYHALEKAGLPNKGGIHCLRHSFATHLLEAGCEIHILKRLMGHTSLSTTTGYLHITRERFAQIKSPLDLLDPPSGSPPKKSSLH